LRMKDVFAVQEVEYAVLETDGLLSVLKKPEFETPNKRDLNVYPEKAQMATPLIMDGEMIKDNLAEVDVTEDWLLQELERQNYTEKTQKGKPINKEGKKKKNKLTEIKVTEDWLMQEIERQNYTKVKKVFYAEWMDNKKMFVLPYRKIKHKQYQKKQQK